MRLFNSELNNLTPRDCLEIATTDGRNAILLIPDNWDENLLRENEHYVWMFHLYLFKFTAHNASLNLVHLLDNVVWCQMISPETSDLGHPT